MEKVCKELNINTKSNRVDIGVRVEIPARVFEHITDAVYESKLTYRTNCHGDRVRTFCMNPNGEVVNERTQIAYSEAIKIEADFEVGEDLSEPIRLKDFGRREILAIGQNLKAKIRSGGKNG